MIQDFISLKNYLTLLVFLFNMTIKNHILILDYFISEILNVSLSTLNFIFLISLTHFNLFPF